MQPSLDNTDSGIPTSRLYTFGLTFSVLLFLATITLGIIVIIIGSGSDERREDEFALTLTSIYSGIHQTQAALGVTLTPAPRVVMGEFAFKPADGHPVYSEGDSCEQQVITGRVVDQEGNPTDRFTVLIWGDYLASRGLSTGELTNQEPGVWRLEIDDIVHRRVWVQLAADGRHFSAPVEIVFDQGVCDRTQADIVFEQVGPLE